MAGVIENQMVYGRTTGGRASAYLRVGDTLTLSTATYGPWGRLWFRLPFELRWRLRSLGVSWEPKPNGWETRNYTITSDVSAK